MTQQPIAANGGRFLYEFDLPDAGTFWYHPHLGSPEQVARGLYGALIVEEREPPTVDRDLVWVLSDWRLDREARIVENFGNPMDASHAGRIGNTVTVNGAIRDSFAVRAGERIRLRLINASNARIYGLEFEGHEPRIIALDGHGVAPHGEGRVVLGPGMRADLILDCAARARERAPRNRPLLPPARLRAAQDRVRARQAAARVIPARAAPRRQSGRRSRCRRRKRHRVVFGGGMMGALPSGRREHRGLFWTVNGKPVPEHSHHEPLLKLALHRSYVIEFENDTSWHHPIHLHGHVFRVLTGRIDWADSVLLDPDSRAEIAFVADNPGDWMLHCHVLEHQASGMMAIVRVA